MQDSKDFGNEIEANWQVVSCQLTLVRPPKRPSYNSPRLNSPLASIAWPYEVALRNVHS
jgi:hypothetical protein